MIPFYDDISLLQHDIMGIVAYLVSSNFTAHVSAGFMLAIYPDMRRILDMGKACVDGRSFWLNGYVLSLVAGWWQMTFGAKLSRSLTDLFKTNRPYIESKHYHSEKSLIGTSSFLSYHFLSFPAQKMAVLYQFNNITVVDPLHLKKQLKT